MGFKIDQKTYRELEELGKKTANKIFGKRKDDYYEKLEKMNKQKNDK